MTEHGGSTASVREQAWALADRTAHALLEAQPLMATYMGVSGYDDLLPDLTPQAHERFRGRVLELYLQACELDDSTDSTANVVVAAARDRLATTLATLDAPPYDLSVTTVPFADGPSMLQFMLAQAVVTDDESARGYRARCEAVPAYLEQLAQRFADSARRGQTPVAALVEQAVTQCEQLAASPEAAIGLNAGKGSSDEWRAEVAQVARDVVQPALQRYADALRAMLPTARPADRPGLLWVPGGAAAYAAAVRQGTTLPLDPEDVHRIGLEELATVEGRILELGSRAFGARTLAEVFERLAAEPPVATDPDALMAHVVSVVRRGEQAAAAVLPEPAAPPCSVEPMPDAVADAGTPPMYRPPQRGGGRPGAYMMNTRRPGPAATSMLETVTFHETVPGHHSQYALLQHVDDLPLLLTSFNVVPHGEGWGLYAELLADELGLYSSDVQRLGMLVSHAWRAVRLVVDTGIHARGWSRERALAFALERTSMPAQFMAAEIDRYIAVPGQALGYLIGLREIVSLRAACGPVVDLRRFHTAVLSHGALPLPTLRLVVTEAMGASGSVQMG